MNSLPTEFGGIPLWAVLFTVAALIFFVLRMSSVGTEQDRYPTIKLFAYIITIFIAIAGAADLIRWANLW